MTSDVSGFGLRARVMASVTFPAGFDVTAFSDDADPVDMPSMQIRDKAMGANGDLILWSKANPVPCALAVIPGSADDINLSVLFESNRVGRGKQGARDVVTIVIFYPNGRTWTGTNGAITDGPAGTGLASSGRLKTNTYQFSFENVRKT